MSLSKWWYQQFLFTSQCSRLVGVGTHCGVKHFRLRMQTSVPILAQGLPSPPFSVVGMPPLTVPLVSQQTALAKRWQDQHPGADPVGLQVGERRANAFARAAFWIATRDLSGEQGVPAAGICDSCGRATYSWCEGCYLRTAGFPAAKFAALCGPCDQEQFVCHNCRSQGIEWQAGHTKYLEQTGQHHGEASQETTQIEITQIDGSPIEPSTFVSLEALAERSGITAEEFLRQLQHAFSGGGSSARGSGYQDGTSR